VEVQVFADMHGYCIHLGERDCSVQRRHQKIIEETPSPAVDATLRERMGRCAVELAQAAGYVGAGTVEFLVEGGEFFLMEMNTRLQVEHPVTEMVTGLDLVEWQLRVAQGEPLPSLEPRFDGHAIEVRLCAEDEEFRPHTGIVRKFLPPPPGEGGGGGTRFDHAISSGMIVPPFYDSMLGKLISHAPMREQAIDQLAQALDRLEILGLPTNRRFLAACLRHPEFRAGRALIPFLVLHGDELRRQLQDDEAPHVRAAALAAMFPSGAAAALPVPFTRPLRVRHRGQSTALDVREDSRIETPRAHVVQVAQGHWHVQLGGVDLFLEDASFDPPQGAAGAALANELRAPFNGKVIAVKTEAGRPVAKGDPLVILESMKLEHAVAAVRDGVVRAIHVQPGQQAATSQVLVTLEAAS
jgi:geranyl-CoA carboxylase alpha subunit